MTLRDVAEYPELLPVIVPVYNDIVKDRNRQIDADNNAIRDIKIQEKINKLKGR